MGNIIQSRLRSKSVEPTAHKKVGHAHLTTMEADEDPKSFDEAMKREDSQLWHEAMQQEIASLKKLQVWELVNRPKCNVVTNRWVLKIKRKPDGQIDRYRARLVARGF